MKSIVIIWSYTPPPPSQNNFIVIIGPYRAILNGDGENGRNKGNPPSTVLRYGEEGSISLSTLIFAAIKG